MKEEIRSAFIERVLHYALYANCRDLLLDNLHKDVFLAATSVCAIDYRALREEALSTENDELLDLVDDVTMEDI